MSEQAERTPEEEVAELLVELRELAETALVRVEPVLRRLAAGLDTAEWSGCSWCPVCATAALLRGEHHDLLGLLADHGVTVVTVLREAFAGMPVDPIMPEGMTPDMPRRAPRGRTGAPAPTPQAYQAIPVTVRR